MMKTLRPQGGNKATIASFSPMSLHKCTENQCTPPPIPPQGKMTVYEQRAKILYELDRANSKVAQHGA